MKNILLICMMIFSLVLSWSVVIAEEGFYVIAVKKNNFAPVPKTGQTTSYATGDDGQLEKGVAWPYPRFTDNGDGTVTDNRKRQLNPIFTGFASCGMMPSKTKEATSWSRYPEPSS